MLKKYCITDPQHYSSQDTFYRYVTSSYLYNPFDYLCIRDNENSKEYVASLLESIHPFCVSNGIKPLVNSYIDIAISQKLFGVHLKSHQIQDIPLCKQEGVFVVYSAHTREDIVCAQKLGADAVTISPIFSDKYNFKALGVEGLKKIIYGINDVKIFALGGITTEKQVDELRNLGLYGIASIRFFTNFAFPPKNLLTSK